MILVISNFFLNREIEGKKYKLESFWPHSYGVERKREALQQFLLCAVATGMERFRHLGPNKLAREVKYCSLRSHAFHLSSSFKFFVTFT